MKVIFLDVDGVLNSEEFYEKNQGRFLIDPDSIKALRRIVEETQAILVLTSSVRGSWSKEESEIDPSIMFLIDALAAEGLSITDKTKVSSDFSRASEIADWILRYPGNIDGYLILDDNDSEFEKYRLHHHWIQTDFEKNGLTWYHVGPAIDILSHGGGIDNLMHFFLSWKTRKKKFR